MDVFKTWKALIAKRYIDRRHALYLKSANPVHAWSAYRMARQLEEPIPGWVLGCFDAWATVLTEETHESAKAIADALKIGKKGGATVTKKAASEVRDLEIVADVLHLQGRPTRAEQEATLKDYRRRFGVKGVVVDPGDRNLTEMMEQVAGERGLDYVSVRAKYYKLIRPPKRSKAF
jgi:hypothetical protein